MKVGVAQVDISPSPVRELSGFAARLQPSLGMLDPLFAKVLFLTDGCETLLWVHCDLIGLQEQFVQSFRTWARNKSPLASAKIFLSATHTHSGPCTINLRECGEYDHGYEQQLMTSIQDAAGAACAHTEQCEIVTATGHSELAYDRRKKMISLLDPRVGGIGFRRVDGTFAAGLIHYAIHPVALGPDNRQVSADLHGQMAASLARALPGNPVVFALNGASGNLNPPAVNVPPAEVEKWGSLISTAVASRLVNAQPVPSSTLRVRSCSVSLPLEVLSHDELEAYAKRARSQAQPVTEWGDKFRRVVDAWQATRLAEVRAGEAVGFRQAELFGISFGVATFIGVNAELFADFAEKLRSADNGTYVVGYANGLLGYVSPPAAYPEGGYEVDTAHFFYGGFRFRPEAHDILLAEAVRLIAELHLNESDGEVTPSVPGSGGSLEWR